MYNVAMAEKLSIDRSVAWCCLAFGCMVPPDPAVSAWNRQSFWIQRLDGRRSVLCYIRLCDPLFPVAKPISGARFCPLHGPQIVRLEPPYLASIVLVLVLWELSSRTPGFAGLPPDYGPSQLLLHLFYLIPLSSERWLNPVYWSLAYEFVFYVSMGLLFPLLFNRHVAWTAVAALSICAATGSALALLFLLGIVAMRFKSGVDTAWEAVTTAMVATVVSPFFIESRGGGRQRRDRRFHCLVSVCAAGSAACCSRGNLIFTFFDACSDRWTRSQPRDAVRRWHPLSVCALHRRPDGIDCVCLVVLPADRAACAARVAHNIRLFWRLRYGGRSLLSGQIVRRFCLCCSLLGGLLCLLCLLAPNPPIEPLVDGLRPCGRHLLLQDAAEPLGAAGHRDAHRDLQPMCGGCGMGPARARDYRV